MWLWVLAAVLSGQVQLGAGARGELQAGQQPTAAGESPSSFAAAFITPQLSLDWLDNGERSHLLYAPRLMWRRPNPADSARPLILHGFRADGSWAPGTRSELRLRIDGSVGDVDYAALNQLLGTQASLPMSISTRLYAIDGVAQLAWRGTRRLRTEIALAAIRRASLDDTPALPAETRVAVQPRLLWSASRLHTLSLSADAALYRLSGAAQLNAIVLSPRVGWQHRLDRANEIVLSAGLAWAHPLDEATRARPFDNWAPLAELAWLGRTRLARGWQLRSTLSAGTAWYLDPVLATGLPRGLATARLAFESGRKLSAEAWAQFATNLTSHPIAGQPDETVLTAGLPVRYRVSPMLIIETGTRFSDRAPHLRASDWQPHGREWVGYVALTVMAVPTAPVSGPANTGS